MLSDESTVPRGRRGGFGVAGRRHRLQSAHIDYVLGAEMTSPVLPVESVEHVLVTPTLLFHQVGVFQGFTADADRYLDVLLDANYISYRPRADVELDPSFKQLIPYCIFRCEGKIFHYRRGKLSGDGRLRSKRSIGVGGHISADDRHAGTSVYREAMRREIAEEVYVESAFTEQCVGLINDDATDVGRVHLGIVHIFDLEAPKVRAREESIRESGFAEPSELVSSRDEFETWSQICLDYLMK
jgi:predicted NUDIX family phosphoesterase